ncbi:hypothetical protein R6Q59_002003 [Mikania micrantha]
MARRRRRLAAGGEAERLSLSLVLSFSHEHAPILCACLAAVIRSEIRGLVAGRYVRRRTWKLPGKGAAVAEERLTTLVLGLTIAHTGTHQMVCARLEPVKGRGWLEIVWVEVRRWRVVAGILLPFHLFFRSEIQNTHKCV